MPPPMPGVRLAPTLTELVPWTDRRGRFHPMRAVVLSLLVLPGLFLFGRWAGGFLPADAIETAIHSTGYWAVWFLVASLVITPVKAFGGSPNIVVVRRMVGNAALIYGLIHLGLYCTDQQWKLWTIVTEIVKRFYLTIGFVALLGLLVLGLTSTDGWVRYLGKTWKRLHRLAYGIMVLALFHYVLQSKLDVSHALLAVGVFTWLMLWRVLPAGRDRSWPWLLLITVGATAGTLLIEFLWYRFGTRIDPMRVMRDEFNVAYALHPAGQALLLGLLGTLLVVLRQGVDTPFGARPWITMTVYALGGVAGEAAPWFFGLQTGQVAMDDPWPWLRAAVWVVLLAILGRVRWRLDAAWQKHAVDALWIASLLFDVFRLTTDDPRLVSYGAGALVAGSVLVAAALWPRHRRAALLLLPLAAALAFQAATA